MPLVPAEQRCAGALGDRLLDQVDLLGGHWILLDHRVVLVVEIKQLRCDSHAHRVTFTSIAVHFNSHDNLLALETTAWLGAAPTIRPGRDAAGGDRRWTTRLERVTTRMADGSADGLPKVADAAADGSQTDPSGQT